MTHIAINRVLRKLILLALGILLHTGQQAVALEGITIQSIDLSSRYPEGLISIRICPSLYTNEYSLDQDSIAIYEDSIPVKKIRLKKSNDRGGRCIFVVDSKLLSGNDRAFARIKMILNSIRDTHNIAIILSDLKCTVLQNFTQDRKSIINSLCKARNSQSVKGVLCIHKAISFFQSPSDNDSLVIISTKQSPKHIIDALLSIQAQPNKLVHCFILCNSEKNTSINHKYFKNSFITFVPIKNFKLAALLIKGDLTRRLLQYKSTLPRDGKKHTIHVEAIINGKKYSHSRTITLLKVKSMKQFLFFEWLIIGIATMTILILCVLMVIIFELKKMKSRIHLIESNNQLKMPAIQNQKDTLMESIDDNQINPAPKLTLSGRLLIKDNTMQTKEYLLQKKETIIGSETTSDIVIMDMQLSARHAKILNDEDTYYIFDLVSNTGTFLNGKKLIRPKQLYDWDEIMMGNSSMIFRIISPRD